MIRPLTKRRLQKFLTASAALSFACTTCTHLLPAQANRQHVTQTSPSIAEQYLFALTNQERVHQGLQALQWDAALTQAAWIHARKMAEAGHISHQFPGEPDLSARAANAGAKFSRVAENVAEAPTAVIIHDALMHSQGHRENILDPVVDSIGIAVIRYNGELWAVEDFDRATPALSFSEQERTVHSLLATPGLQVVDGTEDARKTCEMDTGYVGRKPWFVMRFTAGELTDLPDVLKSKLQTGRYHQAAIGACPAQNTGSFAAYNIAVLLYP